MKERPRKCDVFAEMKGSEVLPNVDVRFLVVVQGALFPGSEIHDMECNIGKAPQACLPRTGEVDSFILRYCEEICRFVASLDSPFTGAKYG